MRARAALLAGGPRRRADHTAFSCVRGRAPSSAGPVSPRAPARRGQVRLDPGRDAHACLRAAQRHARRTPRRRPLLRGPVIDSGSGPRPEPPRSRHRPPVRRGSDGQPFGVLLPPDAGISGRPADRRARVRGGPRPARAQLHGHGRCVQPRAGRRDSVRPPQRAVPAGSRRLRRGPVARPVLGARACLRIRPRLSELPRSWS